MKDHFDQPPSGFHRSGGKGWLRPAPDQHAKKLRKLAEQNASLEEKVAELRALVEGMAPKKRGKK